MALQTINIGASPNDGAGDPLRTAFDKVNDNFAVLESSAFNARDPQFDGGAVADGVTDDTDAINAAIDAIRDAVSTGRIPQGATVTLKFGGGEFRVDGSLNMTAIRAINLLIDGGGAIINAHCSGKPVIDMLDCRWWHRRDLTIWGNQTDVPTIGIQFGRSRTGVGNDAGDSTFENVHIHGYFSRTCMYNFAAETMKYDHLQLYNRSVVSGSRCLIMDSSNIEDIDSEFVTQNIAVGTQCSFNVQLFLSADIRKENGGTPILYQGTGHARHYFVNSYAVSVDNVLVETYKASTITDLWLDVHAETTGLTKYL